MRTRQLPNTTNKHDKQTRQACYMLARAHARAWPLTWASARRRQSDTKYEWRYHALASRALPAFCVISVRPDESHLTCSRPTDVTPPDPVARTVHDYSQSNSPERGIRAPKPARDSVSHGERRGSNATDHARRHHAARQAQWRVWGSARYVACPTRRFQASASTWPQALRPSSIRSSVTVHRATGKWRLGGATVRPTLASCIPARSSALPSLVRSRANAQAGASRRPAQLCTVRACARTRKGTALPCASLSVRAAASARDAACAPL